MISTPGHSVKTKLDYRATNVHSIVKPLLALLIDGVIYSHEVLNVSTNLLRTVAVDRAASSSHPSFIMGNSRPLFLYFHLFQTVVSKCSLIFFADDWNRTADLWNRKQLLYQLSHNHCPARRFYVVPNPATFISCLM